MFRDANITGVHRAWLDISRQGQLPGLREHLRRLAGVDLARPELAALVGLEEHGPRTVSDLAAACSVDISTMSRTLKHLTDRGFVERQRGGDLRCVLVQITAEGRDTVGRLLDAIRIMFAEVLHDWSEQDIEELARLLARLASDLGQYAARPLNGAGTGGHR